MGASREQMKQLVQAWERAAPLLRAQRHRDIRRQNNADAIEAFDSYFKHIMKTNLPKKTSGLVEMYKLLRRQPRG
jgi:hypothetical protein